MAAGQTCEPQSKVPCTGDTPLGSATQADNSAFILEVKGKLGPMESEIERKNQGRS